MPYERLMAIESRLQKVLQLIATGEYSTHRLAKEVGVSVPTISRDVVALRQRGHAIRAERMGMVWHYVLEEEQPQAKLGNRKPR